MRKIQRIPAEAREALLLKHQRYNLKRRGTPKLKTASAVAAAKPKSVISAHAVQKPKSIIGGHAVEKPQPKPQTTPTTEPTEESFVWSEDEIPELCELPDVAPSELNAARENDPDADGYGTRESSTLWKWALSVRPSFTRTNTCKTLYLSSPDVTNEKYRACWPTNRPQGKT